GRYYESKKNFIGAINRFKVVVTRYQTTRHVEEALMRLTECYMTLGIIPEAQTAAAVLGHNFPDSAWYKDAYAIVKGQGYEPQENNSSWISRAFRKIGLGCGSSARVHSGSAGVPPSLSFFEAGETPALLIRASLQHRNRLALRVKLTQSKAKPVSAVRDRVCSARFAAAAATEKPRALTPA